MADFSNRALTESEDRNLHDGLRVIRDQADAMEDRSAVLAIVKAFRDRTNRVQGINAAQSAADAYMTTRRQKVNRIKQRADEAVKIVDGTHG
jgi:hypothetical protein